MIEGIRYQGYFEVVAERGLSSEMKLQFAGSFFAKSITQKLISLVC